MSTFAGKNLTQGGQMTAYRWRMFLQVNNWIGFWVFILFAIITAALFLLRTPQEVLDNGSLYWFAWMNSSFIDLIPVGQGKLYDIHYFYAPTNTALILKMTLPQMLTDPYMQAMGDRVLAQLQSAATVSGIVSVCVFAGATMYVTRIGKKESENEFISGMTLTDKPAEVNRLLRRNGERSDLRIGDLHMVARAEVMNFLIHGTIGVGKSTLIRWLLNYIRKRGDRAIIYDSGCTFTETHYNPKTDFILNAHDDRCANWQMWGECEDVVDYENMAASLIPVEGESDPFWVSSSRTIWADLAIRMSTDPDRSIEKFLKTLLSLSMKSLREYLANTPSANLVEEKIEKTAISIRSVVTNYAKALRYLQGLDEAKRPAFTIRNWMTSEAHDNSWLFISTQARHRKSVRPLISMWVSLATLYLQSMGENADRRVWFIYDEIPSLQKIPDLPETLAEGRKFGACFVLGAQNMAQMVHIYGREMAKSIFDLLNTRAYGRSPSSEMAKFVEEELGPQRRKEAREQNSYGMDSVRDGVSIGKDRVRESIVDYEEIMKLPNLSFYIRLPGEYPVTRLKLKYRKLKKIQPAFIERDFRDALSPELEKLVHENERSRVLSGISFPTGDEIMEDAAPATEASKLTPKPEVTEKVKYVARTDKPAPVAQPVMAQKRPAESETSESESPVAPDNVVSLRPLKPPVVATVNPVSRHELVPSEKPASPVISGLHLLSDTEQQAVNPSENVAQKNQPDEPFNAFDRLNRLRQKQAENPVAATDGTGTEETESGGEAQELEMAVRELEDGGLQITTAGKQPEQQESREDNKASRRMADEEVNILRHRHNDDPGYSHEDLARYEDGEHEL
jgi:type IV conjugative transfer system coupling protein TraD